MATLLAGWTAGAGTVNNCSESDFLSAFDGAPVQFTADCSITLSQTVPIVGDTVIDSLGHNVTINGGSNLVFLVESGTLTLRGLTVSGGVNYNGGAVYVPTSCGLIASNCVFSGNFAAGTNGVSGTNGLSQPSYATSGGKGTVGQTGIGGAVYNLGDAQFYICQFLNNGASGGNGGNGGNAGVEGDGMYEGENGGSAGNGATALGGAIYNAGFLATVNCTFSGNSVVGGSGGVGGTLSSGYYGAGSSGSGGSGAPGSGGAIYSTTNLTVYDCTFSGNTAAGGSSEPRATVQSGNGANGYPGGESDGGAIFCMGSGWITNCTFYGNQVSGGNGGDGGTGVYGGGGDGGNGGNANGGGIYNTGQVVVVSCTIANCGTFGGTNGNGGSGISMGATGRPGRARGGSLANGGGTFSLYNTIAVTNVGGVNITNLTGKLIDGGYNLISDACPLLTNKTSLKLSDAKIQPLNTNGGYTATMALKPPCPATNQIPLNLCPTLDQRGVPRLIGGAGDIGAYEYELTGAPVIVNEPTNTPAEAQLGNVLLSVNAVGAPILRYQWTLFATNLPGANSRSLLVTNVSPTNAGPYIVTISNSLGNVSSTQVFVNLPPFFSRPPTNQSILLGTPTAFLTQVSGDPPLYFQWEFNGQTLGGANSSNLYFASVVATQAGPYVLMATNLYGTNYSSPAILTVNAAPVINQQPVDATVAPGGSATFIVTTANDADPTLKFQWQFYGTNIIGPQALAQTLTISPVAFTNGGPYRVMVANNYGNTPSTTVYLRVLAPSSLLSPTFDGSNLNFSYQSHVDLDYILEYENTLTDAAWIPLLTNVGTDGILSNSVPVSADPGRFFRLQIQ
jgi:hypothetical protein